MEKKIFAIIVTYNGKKWYEKCFGSLRVSSQKVIPVVVDNASTDGTIEYILQNFPEAHVISIDENLGFAKANNIGIKYALDNGADYVFLLNQDAWVEQNTIAELVRTFDDNEHVGIASPIHLNGSYTGLDQGFATYVGGDFVSDAYMRHLKVYYDVVFVNAAAWLLNVNCIKKIGGFDTSLFRHYGEDDNYIQRLRYHKLRLILNTRCTICHDREFRNRNKENDNNVRLNPNIERSEILGNICKPIDIDSYIHRIKKQKVMALLMLNLRKYVRLQEEKKYLQVVKASREFNKKGGLIWL